MKNSCSPGSGCGEGVGLLGLEVSADSGLEGSICGGEVGGFWVVGSASAPVGESSIEFVPNRWGQDVRYAVDATKLRSIGWLPSHPSGLYRWF